jgi:hypothetical protein
MIPMLSPSKSRGEEVSLANYIIVSIATEVA